MKNALRPLALLFCFLLLVQFVCPEEKRPFWSRFSLKVTGGWGSDIPIGDVNDCLESFNNNKVFDSLRKANSDRLVGEIKTLDNQTSHWEAELRFDLTPRISFGIATSAPFYTHNESSVTYTVVGWAGSQIMTWTFKPEIKFSYPIRLNAYYTFSFIPRLNISIGGGVGFYSAKISFPTRFEEILPSGSFYWANWSSEAKRNLSLGFHAAIVFEYKFWHRISLVAEYQQRSGKMSGLKGIYKGGDAHVSSEKRGTLYYFTVWDHLVGARYATLEVFPGFPDVGYRWLEDVREARLDLSGYSIRIGIRLRLI